MIVNWSRLSSFGKCQEKAWNWDHEHLDSWQPAMPLMTGGAFHEAAAKYFSSRNQAEAVLEVELSVRKYLEGKTVLPEEKPEIEHAIKWTQLAISKFTDNYAGQPVQVLWPEVQFCVPIPNSEHYCWDFHKRFCKGISWQEHAQGPLPPLTLPHPPCWQPHYFRGKTDAVVQYLGDVWLFEHKTNSMRLEQFIQKYYLDAQVTGYIYGLWKQLGVQPVGFILNVIQKPHPNTKDQMQAGFVRETFERSLDDLLKFEGEFATQATNYERAFRDRELGNPFAVVRNTTACTDYNRKCAYFDKCQRHPAEALEGEFLLREADYVETAYLEVYQKWQEQQS